MRREHERALEEAERAIRTLRQENQSLQTDLHRGSVHMKDKHAKTRRVESDAEERLEKLKREHSAALDAARDRDTLASQLQAARARLEVYESRERTGERTGRLVGRESASREQRLAAENTVMALKLEEANTRVAVLQQKQSELAQARAEADHMLAAYKKWEALFARTQSFSSPYELEGLLASLQNENALLHSQTASLQAQLNGRASELGAAHGSSAGLRRQSENLRETARQTTEQLQRSHQHSQALEKELTGLRQLLASYQQDTSNTGELAALKARAEEQEQTIGRQAEELAALQAQLGLDPSLANTQVLHMIINPFSQAVQAKKEKEAAAALSSNDMKEEYEKLRKASDYQKDLFMRLLQDWRKVVYDATGWKVSTDGTTWTFESVFAGSL